MGIQGLTKLIADTAPQALKDEDIKNFFGRTVAVDASMTLYQFIIAVRPDDLGQYTLTNDAGEATRSVSSNTRPLSLDAFPPPPFPAAPLCLWCALGLKICITIMYSDLYCIVKGWRVFCCRRDCRRLTPHFVEALPAPRPPPRVPSVGSSDLLCLSVFLIILLNLTFSSFLSHLQGLFYRTIRMITNGIKPVYVFDGKPPELKTRTVRPLIDRSPTASILTNTILFS